LFEICEFGDQKAAVTYFKPFTTNENFEKTLDKISFPVLNCNVVSL